MGVPIHFLRQYLERHVTRKCAAGHYDLEIAGGGARGYVGCDFGSRHYGEICQVACVYSDTIRRTSFRSTKRCIGSEGEGMKSNFR